MLPCQKLKDKTVSQLKLEKDLEIGPRRAKKEIYQPTRFVMPPQLQRSGTAAARPAQGGTADSNSSHRHCDCLTAEPPQRPGAAAASRTGAARGASGVNGLWEVTHSCKSSRAFPDSGINPGNGATPPIPGTDLPAGAPRSPQREKMAAAGRCRGVIRTPAVAYEPNPRIDPTAEGSPGCGSGADISQLAPSEPLPAAPSRARGAAKPPLSDLPSPASCGAAPVRAWLRAPLRPHSRVPARREAGDAAQPRPARSETSPSPTSCRRWQLQQQQQQQLGGRKEGGETPSSLPAPAQDGRGSEGSCRGPGRRRFQPGARRVKASPHTERRAAELK